MQMIPLARLVLDWTLYPRHEVDSTQVSRLANALAVGEELPPIMVDRKSLRIVDGMHRYSAYLRTLGEDGEIPAVLKTYRNVQEMFLDAVRTNARHGVPLESIDQAHAVLLARDLGVGIGKLASAMAIPEAKLEPLNRSDSNRYATGPGGETVILKTALRHKGGGRLTKAQVAVNDSLVGMKATYFIGCVLKLLRHKLFDPEDESVMELLRELKEELKQRV